jgi:hypothetical protein
MDIRVCTKFVGTSGCVDAEPKFVCIVFQLSNVVYVFFINIIVSTNTAFRIFLFAFIALQLEN